jgi:hypothetical protein
MCEECEEAEGEQLREVYLARRARMARTWRPKGPRAWVAEAVATSAPVTHDADVLPRLAAAE